MSYDNEVEQAWGEYEDPFSDSYDCGCCSCCGCTCDYTEEN